MMTKIGRIEALEANYTHMAGQLAELRKARPYACPAILACKHGYEVERVDLPAPIPCVFIWKDGNKYWQKGTHLETKHNYSNRGFPYDEQVAYLVFRSDSCGKHFGKQVVVLDAVPDKEDKE